MRESELALNELSGRRSPAVPVRAVKFSLHDQPLRPTKTAEAAPRVPPLDGRR